MKTYLKTLVRMFKKHITRLLSIISMVVISVGFVAGIGSAVDKINYSMTEYYRAQNVSDFILKSKDGAGFSAEQLDAVKNLYGEHNVNSGMSLDVNLTVDGEEQLVRLYFLREFGDGQTVNRQYVRESLEAADGDKTIAYAEESDNKIKGVPLGTQIVIDFKDILEQSAEENGEELTPALSSMLARIEPVTVTVGKTVLSPLTFGVDGEASYKNGEDVEIPDNIQDVNKLITVENILYLPYDIVPVIPFVNTPLLSEGDMYVALDNRSLFQAFDKGYKTYINEQQAAIDGLEEFGGAEYRALTLYDNYSFNALKSYGDKVRGICIVLMIAFIFVTALVVLSTMTRLIEEERGQVACLCTLGYPAWKIIFKYALFAVIGCAVGGAGAYLVDVGVARLLYYVFNYSFVMPPMSRKTVLWFFFSMFAGIVLVTLLATVIAGRKLTSDKPANLLHPKAPKAGKKVFLERIPFIWNLLSFKYKSTMRNVLRYMSRFLMTVVAVALSTSLVLAGLALLDLTLFHGVDSPAVMAVAIVVVVFAGLLTAAVVYTLTNINISERNREIATLMVLGYHDKEVTGYIYREVYIDTVIGILFGYPLAALLIWAVFTVMGMGTLGGVSWFMWLIAPFVVLLFTFFVTLILRRRIVRIDMNESLKAIE